jgi:hypothetical protein
MSNSGKLFNRKAIREGDKEALYAFFEFIVVNPVNPGEDIE